jgi:chemotaxis protein methyltransferase CheR
MAIRQAKEGIYDLNAIHTFAKNYAAASGLNPPSDFYTADYDLIRFHDRLRENVVFSEHNLATDAAFTEAHLILCRNVLIYFTRELQNRALDLFAGSMIERGFLGIGSKESLRFSSVGRLFEAVDRKQNIYQLKSGQARDI